MMLPISMMCDVSSEWVVKLKLPDYVCPGRYELLVILIEESDKPYPPKSQAQRWMSFAGMVRFWDEDAVQLQRRVRNEWTWDTF